MPLTVTAAEAKESITTADLGDLDVDKVVARTRTGRFLTQQGGSFIVARAAMTFGFVEAAMRAMAQDVASEPEAVDRARAADTLSKLANSAKGILDTERAGMEIAAIGGKKEGQSGRAPTQIIGTQINAENVQAVQAPKPT